MSSPWGAFVIARCWLRAVHRLPFDLPGFLADAHRRGVLTQTAAVWEFRFSALPHRLTSADSAD
ncbi:hypothetical protein [Frankia sp. AgKG'84/4]|uniref:hypothetical protein n=1 Tax=Frankia sp. AgKG'84/4 TaxID=573490 RepID=UPI00200D8B41|nr:hypothetical protein [Frankia sp. AgKG'84/4]MCL9796286.1 hypothetical protein [Frankia sp. AgKG'84/4]